MKRPCHLHNDEVGMTTLHITALREELGFGACVQGVTLENIGTEAVHADLVRLFDAAGMIVFSDIEPTAELQVAISTIAGPLKEHLQKSVPRVDQEGLPGVIEISSAPQQEQTIALAGEVRAGWLPWHFDHCYNDQLNRGAVLRALEVPSADGMTGFLDGILLYEKFSPELRKEIEGHNILYRMNVIMENFHFGRPQRYEVLAEHPKSQAVMDEMAGQPRAIHPAVWTRATGEKVLHVSPWMAEGIQGAENPAGDALLEEVCREIFDIAEQHSYFHQWKTTDMVIWDNWRMLHAVSGHPPLNRRRMHRTTIAGDYGLGRFEASDVAPSTALGEITF
ncbi:MAG: TauD/TfdA family dioxygenase [Novosphingobium sp.]